MSKSGVLRHRDLASTLRSSAFVGWKTLGENILVGPYYMTGDQMFSAWWASTAHRANILSRSFTAAGVGTVVAGTKVWATMNFGG